MKSIFAGYFIIIVYNFNLSFELQFNDDMDVADLSIIEITEKYNYPIEIHRTETEDGFVLMLHRIPYGKHSNQKKPGFPIILHPGFPGSGNDFFILGPKSLSFCLADEGYDVWVVNYRGTNYSSLHKYLTKEDEEYWDFSWHEIGVYDLPAHITYVCNQTDHEDVMYLGFSMGATAYFVMASERPEFLKKVRASIFLAPVVFLKHLRSPLRHIAPLGDDHKAASGPLTEGPFFEKCSANEKNCIDRNHHSGLIKFAKHFIFYINGRNSDQLTDSILINFLTHFPDKGSMKTLMHYFQLVRSGKFRQFDYGIIKNKKKYNSQSPPEYNLKATTTPLYIFLGKNDFFTPSEDLKSLFKELPNIKTVDTIPYSKFTHLDFFTGKDAKTLLYVKVVERLKEILREEKSYDEESQEEEK